MNSEVAVAVIVDEHQRILITQRPLGASHGGCWEFPGGKLEVNESSDSALIREIREEIGIEVEQYQFLGEVNYLYPDKEVKLIIFLVTQYFGVPSCLENQPSIKWIHYNELNPKDFPEANKHIIALVTKYFSLL